MDFLIVLLLVAISVILLTMVIPFCYFFFKSTNALQRIEKKLNRITAEYNTFLIHKSYAEYNKIAYSEPFAVTYTVNNITVTTSKISQAAFLSSLTAMQNDLDSVIYGLPEGLINTSIIQEYIAEFNKIKEGISAANPYK